MTLEEQVSQRLYEVGKGADQNEFFRWAPEHPSMKAVCAEVVRMLEYQKCRDERLVSQTIVSLRENEENTLLNTGTEVARLGIISESMLFNEPVLPPPGWVPGQPSEMVFEAEQKDLF